MSHREDIEPHEIFLDKIAKKTEERYDLVEKKLATHLPKNSIMLPFRGAVFVFILFLLKVVQLQIMNGAEYSAQAENNKYLFYKVQADRGIIFDKNFKPLVDNASTFDLVCDQSKMYNSEEGKKRIVNSLAEILKVAPGDILKKIDEKEMIMAENLDHERLIVMEARIHEFQGCEIGKRPIRKYAADKSLSHLLGYMGKIEQEEWTEQKDFYSIYDYIGRTGLESSYEAVLRKNPGQIRIERDAKGNIVSKNVSSLPESGKSVVLWLDLDLQKKISEEMQKQLKALALAKAAAVAIDPKTGGILAMVSFPEYDNNAFAAGDAGEVAKLLNDRNNPLFNRAIAGQYLTGSTIKPLEAAGALQEELIGADKSIYCGGKIVIPNKYNPELSQTFNDNHTHGMTDMRKAIAESCNVFFWTIGGGWLDQQGLGPTRIKKYLGLFGWEDPTGVDLPGEASGFIPDPAWKKEKFLGTQDQNWTDGDTYNLAIGQGFIGITPLQVANAFAAIANGGTLYRPQAVQKVVDSKRNVIEAKKTETIRQGFIDAKNLQVVREGMRQAVNGKGSPLASSLVLNSLPVAAAAKTGTAQVRKDAYGKDIMNSWVTVFAPYDDPQIVLTIMMEDVKEGQLAVLPVAKEVLSWYFSPREQLAGTAEPASATTTDNSED
ncbi:MAG TPA: penicillin-binding protein 2 [Candidatus Paceibacterota bacterium]|nr:penicillin-binding protein 2 [Candidatus Pacearchaeota archaeon]HRZ51162.1 penicillin-binding protein 2 [Candidatus Paceibacterota bacterium]HSA36831.1 penicillin-binding protein 2 [Candidatus Paceibacterota bacterium]